VRSHRNVSVNVNPKVTDHKEFFLPLRFCVLFCIKLPNFAQIELFAAE